MAAAALVLETTSDWDAIEASCSRCTAALRAAELAEVEVAALAMVARELLENAVKYGAFGEGRGAVTLALEVGPREVALSVSNPVLADGAHVARARQAIAWIASFAEPLDAYAEAVDRLSRWSRAGGLGLARIAAEGRCALSADVEGGTVVVRAVRRRGLP